MRYTSGSAFRQSLEKRIFEYCQKKAIPLPRLRKSIAFERLLARLIQADPQNWVLKGGFMMELYFQHKARTTKDIDFLYQNKNANIHQQLLKAGAADLQDWFNFEVGKPTVAQGGAPETMRFNVNALLDSRSFETFHIDVNTNDVLFEKPETLFVSEFLAFAEIKPIKVLCYPLTQQIAEKFHALTRTYSSGEASRVKDLIDILLIANNKPLSSNKIRRAIESTFDHRATHKIPATTPEINKIYSRDYSRLSRQAGLKQTNINGGNQALEEFLLPVITSKIKKTWNPNRWQWE